MSIEEHIVLASNNVPASRSGYAAASTASLVGYATGKGHRRHKRVCVAAPEIGLTVYDLADQTPLSSITLGPSFRPTTAPAARASLSGAAETSARTSLDRRIWVGVDNAGTHEVWSWSESENKDGSAQASPDKVVHTTREPLASILAPPNLPGHLVFQATSGAISIVKEDDLSQVAALPASTNSPAAQAIRLIPVTPSILAHLPASTVAAIPTPPPASLHIGLVTRSFSAQTDAVATSLVNVGKQKFAKQKRQSAAAVLEAAEAETSGKSSAHIMRTEVEIILLDSHVMREGETSARIASLGTTEIDGQANVVLGEDGFMTVFDADGLLKPQRVTISPPTAAPLVYADVFAGVSVASLTLTPLPTLNLALPFPSTAMLALHSSFVLFVFPSLRTTTSSSALTSPSKAVQPGTEDATPHTLTAIVLDVRLGSALTTSTILLPASFTSSPSLALSRLDYNSAVLSITPTKPNAKSQIVVLPLALPTASVLAAVVGKQSLTRQFLRSDIGKVDQETKLLEPLPHPRASDDKRAFLAESQRAREAVLARLQAGEGSAAWDDFLDSERARLREFRETKSLSKKEERKGMSMGEVDTMAIDSSGAGKVSRSTRLIEEAIAGAEGQGWEEVTKKRIKNVSDTRRFQYFEKRKAKEEKEALGQQVAQPVKREKRDVQPVLPSSFVPAVLRAVISESTVESDIVRYLLERGVVADSALSEGFVRTLAEASDWDNVLLALRTVKDIPEETTINILKRVINTRHKTDYSMVVDSSPASPIPRLEDFLRSFVESPCGSTPLRKAIQTRLTASEVLPVLEVLDEWLDGETVTIDLPSLDKILPLIQAILDAHFISLLLQRDAHPLLSRMQAHVRTHLAVQDDLAALVGALTVFNRVKVEQDAARLEAKSGKKDKLDTMDKRIKAQEKHAEVLDYAIERFWL